MICHCNVEKNLPSTAEHNNQPAKKSTDQRPTAMGSPSSPVDAGGSPAAPGAPTEVVDDNAAEAASAEAKEDMVEEGEDVVLQW